MLPSGIVVLSKVTPSRFAPSSFASIRTAPDRFAPCRNTLARSAPDRFTAKRFAFLKLAPLRFASTSKAKALSTLVSRGKVWSKKRRRLKTGRELYDATQKRICKQKPEY